MGVRPHWEPKTGRVTGFEILPASRARPAARRCHVARLGIFPRRLSRSRSISSTAPRAPSPRSTSPPSVNPLAARVAPTARRSKRTASTPTTRARRAGYRVFGSKPGAYGAGLQALIDERRLGERGRSRRRLSRLGRLCLWRRRARRAAERRSSAARLGDGRSGDATTRTIASTICSTATTIISSRAGSPRRCAISPARAPTVYHNDHSRPERAAHPHASTRRSAAWSRARAANPKWITGVMRHGYKGGFEIAATVDYLFAFAATARAVDDHHFDALYDAYLGDDAVRGFLDDAQSRRARAKSRRASPRRSSAGCGGPKRNDVARAAACAIGDERHARERRRDQRARQREDGASARRRATEMLATKTEERGLLIVHTGTGKGKSTAAFGMVLRCLGHGMRVGIVQFVKGAWETGERQVLAALPRSRHLPRHGRGLHLGHAGPRARHRRGPRRLGGGARR